MANKFNPKGGLKTENNILNRGGGRKTAGEISVSIKAHDISVASTNDFTPSMTPSIPIDENHSHIFTLVDNIKSEPCDPENCNDNRLCVEEIKKEVSEVSIGIGKTDPSSNLLRDNFGYRANKLNRKGGPLNSDFIQSPSIPIGGNHSHLFTLVTDIKLEPPNDLENSNHEQLCVEEMIKTESEVTNRNINPNKKISHMRQELNKCKTCGQMFLSSFKLMRHKSRKHARGKLKRNNKCELCGKRFAQLSSLIQHKLIHTGEKPFSCKTCGINFRYSKQLRIHAFTHTGEKPYKCELCGKCFSVLNDLTLHKSIHTGEKPYKCDVCGKEYRMIGCLTKHKFLVHMKLVSFQGEKHYKCETCGKMFSRAAQLNKHEVTHTFFKCEICGSDFSNSSRLGRHKLTHPKTREKPTCKECGKNFPNRSSLKQHQIIHTGERPYECNLCGKSYRRSSDLNSHKVIHTGEKSFQCKICWKSFFRSSDLRNHTLTHTQDMREKLYKCETCGKRFFIPSQLVKHKVVHTREKKYKCELCQKQFIYLSSLNGHKKRQHRVNVAETNSEQKLQEHVNFLPIIQKNINMEPDNHIDGNTDPLSNVELETHSLNERRKRRKQKLQVRSESDAEFQFL